MKITDFIQNIFSRRVGIEQGISAGFRYSKNRYGDLIFFNCCQIISDLLNDVILKNLGSDIKKFSKFKNFIEKKGERILIEILKKGYCIIQDQPLSFEILNEMQYELFFDENGTMFFRSLKNDFPLYVLTSATFDCFNLSDYQILKNYINYIDTIFSSSNATLESLGSLLIISPASQQNSPIQTILKNDEKELIETDLSENYGIGKNQKKALVFPKPMNAQTISLNGVDSGMIEKCRFAIAAICDRLKIPIEKVSILSYEKSNGFSNGGEQTIADLNLIKTFERIFEKTIINFSKQLGMSVDYEIYNKNLTVI